MRPFFCSVCGQLLFFDNSTCLGCGSDLGYLPDAQELVALRATADGLERADGTPGFSRHCTNQVIARCNWLVPCDDPAALCASCRLTSVRPNDNETDSVAAFANAEAAKRRLVHQLLSLGLPVIGRSVDPVNGVAFELLSSRARTVITGHDSGVITLDLSESDDVHREFVRQQLGEPYRTVLGHLRHEIGHYYWQLLVVDSGQLEAFRSVFGEEQRSYDASREQHYANGAGTDWSGTHVSEYATMHPWEDWAETFAHYLHIDAGLATATGIGLDVHDPARSAGIAAWSATEHVTIGPMVQRWLGLTIALNAMARSIGQPDLYPFVLSPNVVEKLDFVHRAITSRTPG
jgi:hypothetical protein